MNNTFDVWEQVLKVMETQLEVSQTTITTWFDDVRVASLSNDTLTIIAPVKFKRDIIKSHHADKIKKALKILFSLDMNLIVYSEDENPDAKISLAQEEADADEYSFERFVVGSSNKFAYAVAKAVADMPGKAYNPIFIYGRSGLGKTHLLYAISRTVKNNRPKARIVYIKGDEFLNEFISATQAGHMAAFREKYRKTDMLLVDDVQFIAGKIQLQEEFFNTFNTLYEAKKQIVLCADRPPIEMATLEDRLKSRFQQDVMADIQPPDYETRMAILNLKAARVGLDLPNELKEIIADNITVNVRQLEGVVKRMLAYRDLLGAKMTEDLIYKAIKDVFRESPEMHPTPDSIISAVAKYFETDTSSILGKDRSKLIMTARHASVYLIREIMNLSYPEIGKFFNRHYTTILSSYEHTKELIQKGDLIKDQIKDINNNILGS